MKLGKASLILLLPLVTANAMEMGHMDMSSSSESNSTELVPVAHEMHHMHGVPILETQLTPLERLYWESYNTTSFFNMETPYHSYVMSHFGLLTLVLFLLYPASLILNNVGSNWYLPALFASDLVTVVSLFSYMVFINNVEDLYPGNVYGKMGVILLFLLAVHFVSAVIKTASQKNTDYQNLNNGSIPMRELNVSGSESPASTLYNRSSTNSRGSSTDFELEDDDASSVAESPTQQDFNMSQIKLGKLNLVKEVRDNVFAKVFNNPVVVRVSSLFGRMASVLFALTNYILLCYLFVYYVTGVTVLTGIGQGNRVFNVLAHFIKGGVFFCLGVLSLARYLGSFNKAGLGWNASYIGKYEQLDSFYLRHQPRSSMLTMELIESSLILFYGCTNIFLEHLASPSGAWTAKDLQHASIAFMFIGCGLCGVLTEIKLSSWRRERFMSTLEEINSSTGVSKIEVEAIQSCTPGFSPNPFPAFTIFFTGLLMSQHAQASQLATTVHVQWGTLLTYGSVVRLITILLMTFWRYNSYESLFKPVRPFTELITSFALLAGGFIFMESTSPVIDAMEYRGFTAMFTLNVSIGLVTLLMGWIMLLFSWKDHLKLQN